MEMASAIVIVSVLAALGVFQLAATTSFESVAIRNSMVSLIRGSQQSALTRSNVILKIENTGSEIVFSESQGGVTVKTRSFENTAVVITAGSVGAGTSCSIIGGVISLSYDSIGEIEDADSDGFPICLNGENSLCISPSGFAHNGACL